jgi:hypothetical protein
MNYQEKKEYNRKYQETHRENRLAYGRKYRLERKREINREYHHQTPKAKIAFCNDPLCGKRLDWTRYNEHYCSREHYLAAFDKYRVVIK